MDLLRKLQLKVMSLINRIRPTWLFYVFSQMPEEEEIEAAVLAMQCYVSGMISAEKLEEVMDKNHCSTVTWREGVEGWYVWW